MKVFIIGGSGFIGTRLCQRLKNDPSINFIILDKNKSEFFPDEHVYCDIRNIESLRELIINCDCVINLAAEHKDNVVPKRLYDEVNVEGADNLVKVCEEKNINHIIFTSSVAVYGFTKPNTDESGPFNYYNDYGRTKYEAEKIYQKWYEKDPEIRTLTIIRPTVVFGERNRGNVYNLIKQINSGLFLQVGDGNNIKSMAYVENVAAFIEYAIKNFKGLNVFNYVDKPDLTTNELIKFVRDNIKYSPKLNIRLPFFLGYIGGAFFDLLSSITGKEYPISRIRIKKFCATTQFSTSIPQKTNFNPPVTIFEGLERFIKYDFLREE